MRVLVLFTFVVALATACGGASQGSNAPGQSPCERSCTSQESACSASCMSQKQSFQNSCDSRCGDDNARCLAACG